jgi:hypothetical protein
MKKGASILVVAVVLLMLFYQAIPGRINVSRGRATLLAGTTWTPQGSNITFSVHELFGQFKWIVDWEMLESSLIFLGEVPATPVTISLAPVFEVQIKRNGHGITEILLPVRDKSTDMTYDMFYSIILLNHGPMMNSALTTDPADAEDHARRLATAVTYARAKIYYEEYYDTVSQLGMVPYEKPEYLPLFWRFLEDDFAVAYVDIRDG